MLENDIKRTPLYRINPTLSMSVLRISMGREEHTYTCEDKFVYEYIP